MMKKLAVLIVLLYGTVTIGCGSSGNGGGDGNGNGGSDGGGGGGGGGGVTYSLTWGPIDVQPGAENTQCVILELDNDTSVPIGTFKNTLGTTSHHFILYKIGADNQLRPDPYDCQPFSDILDGAPLMITQRAEETLQLPPGVAYTLEPKQKFRLEMHYINATDSVQTLSATTEFTTIPAADFENEAGFVFVGDVDIDIPPLTSITVGKTFVPMPPEMNGVNYFAITGHTHQFGTDVKVATATSEGGTETSVYDIPLFNWDEPETISHSPAFTIPDGGGFRFSCDYNNTSDQRVQFGESANDEMCFFWAYYYPSKGARICAQKDGVGSVCCPGNALCGLIGF